MSMSGRPKYEDEHRLNQFAEKVLSEYETSSRLTLRVLGRKYGKTYSKIWRLIARARRNRDGHERQRLGEDYMR